MAFALMPPACIRRPPLHSSLSTDDGDNVYCVIARNWTGPQQGGS